MKSLRTILATGAALTVLGGLAPLSAAVTDPPALLDAAADRPGTPGTESSGHISHVANIPYSGGTDLEFTTKEVVKLDGGATGDPVCATDANGDCLTDEQGNVIFETEERDFAIAGVSGQHARVIDITDPRAPVQVAMLACRFNQNDIQIQGDLVFQAADTSGSVCTRAEGGNLIATVGISDISNPREPELLGGFRVGLGAHNVTVHPTEPYAYVSNSELVPGGRIHIWDFSDPASPRNVGDWVYAQGLHPPHDITFNADGSRAYAAAISTTLIINSEDPENLSLISVIPNEGISIAHQSDPTPDGKYLLVSDELGGGGVNTVSPGGPVHVYDIRVEQRPVKIGAFGNDTFGSVQVSTAHVFRINPDGYTMAIAWYQDGIGVVDFSEVRGLNVNGVGNSTLTGPRVIAWMKRSGSNAWSAKMWQERHPGYVFVNDIALGFDVYEVPELGGGFMALGTVEAGHRLNFPPTSVGVTRTEFQTNCDLSPASNGVDGWVTAIPARYADGDTTLTGAVVSSTTADWDVDLYYFNASCALISADEDEGTVESGPIPQGAKYVMGTVWTSTADANLKIRFSTS